MKIKYSKICFFIILVLTITPIFIFPLVSSYFHPITDSPSIKNEVLDLEGYDLSKERELPLDGVWEFYNNKWIVTQNLLGDEPDLMVQVPGSWDEYNGNGKELYNEGFGSYRILLKSCPENIKLISYIPNINAQYRVYINERLVSSYGKVDSRNLITFSKGIEDSSFRQYYLGIQVTEGSEAELIIEVSSPYIGGLNMIPILTEINSYEFRSGARYLVMATFLGILAVTISCIAFILIMNDKSFSSLSLLVMDILVLLRILNGNEYLAILRNMIPFHDYVNNAVLHIVILFLPIVFLFCAKQLVKIQIKKKTLLIIGFYELLFTPFILWSVLAGKPEVHFLLCVISYIPFIFAMVKIYQSVKQGIAYSLTVSAILMFILSSIIVTTLSASGFIIINIALYPPTCFVISILLQLFMYIRKNIENQNNVIETENLRLRLKEREMDLMLSQIKPHFLYNTLIAIHVLCTEEPETASETILKFAMFLRTNMRFINSKELVPFSQELEHIRNYADIEKLRFQKRLNLRYEIETTNFDLPPLTIQPIVENAIKYGACKKIEGGTVILKSYETSNYYVIEVIDDGPGFDTRILEEMSMESHGLKNITFRLKKRIGAEIMINSIIDCGTTIQVKIRKEADYEIEDKPFSL